jgi:hypothetical protein
MIDWVGQRRNGRVAKIILERARRKVIEPAVPYGRSATAESSGNAPLHSSVQAREKNAVFIPETAFVNSLWRGYKNF